jgi:hypothetical protein
VTTAAAAAAAAITAVRVAVPTAAETVEVVEDAIVRTWS